MKKSGNILFCGVGGQGILLASELTAEVLLSQGHDAKKSEVHGMAQRGGSVEAHLRYGKKVYSPLIEPGTADLLLAFEIMEALRYLPYLHEKSKVIVNTQRIMPPAVATGKTIYPENILEELTGRGLTVIPVDGFEIAREAGNVKAANVALVGALSTLLPIPEASFLTAIEKRVPSRFLEINLKVFKAGRKAGKES
ncbi:MAG: indolepyruvate oxidoreductase subunit beta [Proteobacteria bacterium]|nr:indolepyruvate oxidoreductase subunit beta [Pseudomonadota bacterium]MBU1687131.1 indolepyruvate oxidoreductase subunit beta [Pseudomonadota bacterium]